MSYNVSNLKEKVSVRGNLHGQTAEQGATPISFFINSFKGALPFSAERFDEELEFMKYTGVGNTISAKSTSAIVDLLAWPVEECFMSLICNERIYGTTSFSLMIGVLDFFRAHKAFNLVLITLFSLSR